MYVGLVYPLNNSRVSIFISKKMKKLNTNYNNFVQISLLIYSKKYIFLFNVNNSQVCFVCPLEH